MEFLVLGPLEAVEREHVVPLGSAKQRLLLAVLLVNASSVVSVDRLADVLWGDEPPVDAVAAVQTYVSRLRGALEPGRGSGDQATMLCTRAPGYLLRIDRDQLDAARFEQALTEGERLLAAGDSQSALERLDTALGLWRGDAYAEFADLDFARTEAVRLEELRKVAVDERVEAKLSLGRHAELVGELEGLVAGDPLRERTRGQLMLALYRSGREAEALRAYQEYRAHLGAEVGVDPSIELQALERAMIDRSPDLRRVPVSVPAAAPPSSVEPRYPPAAGVGAPRRPSTELPTGELTFMFTDLEGSTRLWEEHPEAMKAALARHDEILRGSIATNHGHVVKMTGDGALAVFEMAPDAVTAAVETLRALATEPWGPTGPLRVRMAIHTGDAELRNGDYFGPVPNRTSRLMAAAHGGQFVLSEASAALVRSTLSEDLGLLDLGEHRLSGLARPERVFQLTIEGLRDRFPPLQSLDAFPRILQAQRPSFARDDELAGRQVEVEQLVDAWKRAGGGALQVALVAGEPGIGKTRLAAEVARRVHGQGGIVFYGRCDEEAAVPYQPFVEALRDYVAACPSSALHERLHGLEWDLARVFPELLGRLPDAAMPGAGEPETERYRFFEAVTRLLNGITTTQPAVLVLDDVHWADKPTLMLFRHLMRSAQGAALLIVACYRDVDAPRDAPFGDLLADLRRERSVTNVALLGLSEAESGELLERVAGHAVSVSLTAALHHETNGNPFFLEELLRHLVETNRLPGGDDAQDVDLATLDLPDSVRDVVERRLRRLPSAVNDVLGLAAVIGPEFDAGLLEQADDRSRAEVLDSLDQATNARLVQESGRIGRYTFSHSLIRQTLYRALGTARRAQLHARVGEALEAASAGERTAAALAHHFTQAIPLLGPSKAIEYSTLAGHEALTDVAFEDAVTHFERALRLLEDHASGDTARRVELLTDLASALVYVDERAGVQAALRAVDEARAGGSPAQFGHAVAVFVEPAFAGERFPHLVSSLVDEARAGLGDEHPALQARLLAFEAFKYAAYQLRGRDGCALAENAVALARRAADPVALTDALFVLAASLDGTERLTERLALGEELLALAPQAGGRAAAFGLRVLASAHLARGDADALTRTIDELARVGDELRWAPARVYAIQLRGTHALLEGRFDDVRSAGSELRRFARAYRAAAGMHTHQGFYLEREEGGLVGLAMGELPDEHYSLYATGSLALAQLEAGDSAAAQARLDAVAAADYLRDEWESARPGALAMLAEVAVSTGTPAHAEELGDELARFSGLLLTGALGIVCLGACDRFLAMLSTALGRWDDAEAQFERALDLEERIRGHALLPRTRYWQARFRRARGVAGDAEAARDLLEQVVDETSRLGMRHLQQQAEELLAG